MNSDNRAALPFIDLLTCGMGGVLVLFFVVMAAQEELGSGTRFQDQRDDAHVSPFIAVAKGARASQLWDGGGESPWAVDPAGNWEHHAEHGADYALLYAATPPPPSLGISLSPAAAGADGQVQIYHQGNRIDVVLSREAATTVWPLAEMKDPGPPSGNQ